MLQLQNLKFKYYKMNILTHLVKWYVDTSSKRHIFPCNEHHMLGNKGISANHSFSNIPHNTFSYFNTKSIGSGH